ncbi:SMP-30/gluconolactonase/LRE family protein [Antrihabitans spumae]|uniref:SMP-30/gluconolactonase/LRE family protein n=1 Tax=Antrihabitans spumae TaxID=3373370 RepID=A0ABW7K3E6_9NOCA
MAIGEMVGFRNTRSRVGAATATAVLAACLAAGGPSVAHAVPTSCAAGWGATTLASGLGWIENLESDGKGGFFLTGADNGEIYHVNSERQVTTLLRGLDKPAGIRLIGDLLYFVTGDDPTRTVADGTLQRLDLGTGEVTVLVEGLFGPNGLLLLPDGDLLISRLDILGPPTGITRYRPATRAVTPSWSKVQRSNGLALSPDGKAFYTGDVTSTIIRIPLDAPDTSTVVSTVPNLIALPDDMQATADGSLFVADHLAGAVYRVDLATGESCSIVTGLTKPSPIRIPPDGPTSVRIAADGDGWALYVTAFDGTLRKFVPPADVDLTPIGVEAG